MNFTEEIKRKGWTVTAAITHWNYKSTDVYYRWVKEEKYHNRLKCLINGLPKKDK